MLQYNIVLVKTPRSANSVNRLRIYESTTSCKRLVAKIDKKQCLFKTFVEYVD